MRRKKPRALVDVSLAHASVVAAQNPRRMRAPDRRAESPRCLLLLRLLLRWRRGQSGRFQPRAGVLVLLLVTGGYFFLHRAPKLTEKDAIVIADFSNSTGDTTFDDTLKQALSVQLAQSPYLNILSDEKVNDTLKLMGRPAGDRLTKEVAREICQRTASTAMLSGTIAQVGDRYDVLLKAVNCATGDSLASTEAEAADKNHVLDALGKVATSMREKLGESLATIQKFDTPLEQATTPSLDALKAYSEGQRARISKGDAPAIPFFKRAIELDPNFASAYVDLGIAYGNLGEVGLQTESMTKAYELRDRVSEREKVPHFRRLFPLRYR